MGKRSGVATTKVQYSGASNMMGKKSGVGTKLLAEQREAVAAHCQGHSLSLAVKGLPACCKVLCETMRTVREIYVLVKYSPKREECRKLLKETLILILINFWR